MKKHTPINLLAGFLLFVSSAVAQVAVPENEEIEELSPFVVQDTTAIGYRAEQTLAGTRLNTDVNDVGAAISVYTPEFIQDTDAEKIEDILTYTTSTEAGGVNGNYSGGITNESGDEVRSNPSGTIRVRAFADATRTRDYFASDLPSDSYNFSTVTVSRGPNAILAGIGAPGGIVDVALKKARFTDAYSAGFEIGKHSSYRGEFHINKVLIQDKLSVRMDGMYEDRQFRQDPAGEEDQRLYGALTWNIRENKPTGFLGGTTLRANYERGEISGIPPNTLTPVMSVNSWFPDDPTTANPYWSINGATREFFDQNGNPLVRNIGDPSSYFGWQTPGYTLKDGFPIFRQWAAVFPGPNATDAVVGFSDAELASLQGFQGTIAGGPTGGFFRGTGDWGRNAAGFARTRLLDPQIFDFYNQLFTGAIDSREQEFDALDVRLEQLFWGGKAGIELAYNQQNFDRIHNFPATGLSSGSNEVFIDTNQFLPIRSATYPDGIPNPNFGRPMLKSFSAFRDSIRGSEDESYQATAFVMHDFRDTLGDSFLGRLIGEHTLTGLYFDTERLRESRDVTAHWTNAGSLNLTDSLGTRIGTFTSQATAIWYVGEAQLGNNLSDLRLQPLSGGTVVPGQEYTFRVYQPSTDSFVTGTTTPKRVFSLYRDQLEAIESTALAWQGNWLDGNLITVVGWRDDQSENFTSVDPVLLDDGELDLSDFELVPASSQKKESWTYSVVARFPEEYLFELPAGADLRFSWNSSENFSPVGQRRNQFNEEVGSPIAETEEYGVVLGLMDGRFNLRINHFETTIANAGVSGPTNVYSYIGTLVNRMLAARDLGLEPQDFGYESFSSFDDVAMAFFDILPQRLQANIGPENNFDPRFVTVNGNLTFENDGITNLASLSTIKTEGWEYELFWSPTENWRIALNASKTEAVISDIAEVELAFARQVLENAQSMFNGDLLDGNRNPGQADPGATWVSQYQAEHISPNETQNALSGQRTPEIREWKFNALTNYDFTDGPLKGFSVGGALRWLDDAAVGYPFITVNGEEVADVDNPYFDEGETRFDFNLRYKKQLDMFDRDVLWTIRFQLDNVFGDDELLTIYANPDGSQGTVRISPEPKVWTITNTIEF